MKIIQQEFRAPFKRRRADGAGHGHSNHHVELSPSATKLFRSISKPQHCLSIARPALVAFLVISQ
jgi:hypothetical protein